MKKSIIAAMALLGLVATSEAAIIKWGLGTACTYLGVKQGGTQAYLMFLDPADASRTLLDNRTTATAPAGAIGTLGAGTSALQTITHGAAIPGTALTASTGQAGFFVRVFNTAGTHYIDSAQFVYTGTATVQQTISVAMNWTLSSPTTSPKLGFSSAGWTPVPEPATGMLALAGAAMLIRRRRRG